MHGDTPFLQASFLCEGMATDEAGRHTFHNEFSEYMMGYSREFTVVNIWRGGQNTRDSDYVERVEIIAHDGRLVAEGETGPFKLIDATFRQVNSTLFNHIDFTHSGIYRIRVALSTRGQPVVTVEYPFVVS